MSKSVENKVTAEIIRIEPEENAVNTVVDKIIQSKPQGSKSSKSYSGLSNSDYEWLTNIKSRQKYTK